MINRRLLILSYTIQQVKPTICATFHYPKCSWEIFDKNLPMPYIWVTDGKKEKRNQKEGKNSPQHIVVLLNLETWNLGGYI